MGKKRDYGLILSLGILIAAGSYWFVKELPTDRMEYYVDILGNRLVELVPKPSEKEQLSTKYNQLKEMVKEKEVHPEDLEKMAAAIINLSNSQDTLSLSEAESLLELATAREDSVMEKHRAPAEIQRLPEKWDNLHARLDAIYKLDQKLKEEPVANALPAPKKYRVDSKLNIIIDSSERQRLENEAFIRKLEQEKQLVWMYDMVKNLKIDLKTLEKELTNKHLEYDKNEAHVRLEILAQPIIDKSFMIIDSLDNVTGINWDSLEKQIVDGIKVEVIEPPEPHIK